MKGKLLNFDFNQNFGLFLTQSDPTMKSMTLHKEKTILNTNIFFGARA